jgi:hypothetical protein
MKTVNKIFKTAKNSYVIALLVTLGAFASLSAVFIAWPSLAYHGLKM